LRTSFSRKLRTMPFRAGTRKVQRQVAEQIFAKKGQHQEAADDQQRLFAAVLPDQVGKKSGNLPVAQSP
jgi:hypothetical protein